MKSAKRKLQTSIARAFTLTEIMIVIAIIVLVIAVAVPAFNYITGSRSTDSAQNLISAMLGRARTYAMANQRFAGIAFFVNPKDGRTTMALVVQKAAQTSTSEDAYLNYKAWSPTTLWRDPVSNTVVTKPTRYYEGQEVIWYVADANGSTPVMPPPASAPLYEERMLVKRFVAKGTAGPDPINGLKYHDSDPTNTVPPNTPTGSSQYWGPAEASALDFEEGDFQSLPMGVGVQLINDPKAPNHDRYLRTGVIMFDSRGRVVATDFRFKDVSAIGQLLGIPSGGQLPPVGSTAYSQVGLVIYDQEAFVNQTGHTENDPDMPVPTLNPYPRGGFDAAEIAEETWLDQNALPLYLNRYNGTLMRGE